MRFYDEAPTGAIGDRATRILLFVLAWDRPWGPSVRECGAAVGLESSQSVWTHLKRLRSAGLVTWEPQTARTLRPTVGCVAVHGRQRTTERDVR